MRFVYIGGIDFDQPLPDECTAFGVAFVKDEPRDVTPDLFTTPMAYGHAIGKLLINKYFRLVPDIVLQTVIEDEPEPVADIVEAAPRKRGRPRKVHPVDEDAA